MRVIFALGFRPFFLLAGWLAILLMAFWVPVFVGWVPFDTYYGQIGWHSHETIFGYTMAVIAGFLLTAVRTGRMHRRYPDYLWREWARCGSLPGSCRFLSLFFRAG
jgi:uncharacterized protein involved in response to NO